MHNHRGRVVSLAAEGKRLRGAGDHRKKTDMYTKDVSANVHLYEWEVNGYCGEANAQMARNGYPDASDRLLYSQKQLEGAITIHQSTKPEDQDKFSTDPQGLQGCLQSLSAAPVNWTVNTSSVRGDANRFMMDSMNRKGFPTPVLINRGHHWVLVVGWITDVNPEGNSDAQLQHVHVYDPEIPASQTMKSAQQWNRTTYFGKVDISGSWLSKFVVVGQAI